MELKKILNGKFVPLYFEVIPISNYHIHLHFDEKINKSQLAALQISIINSDNQAHTLITASHVLMSVC